MAYIKKEPIIEFIKKGLNNPNKLEAFGHDAIEILAEIEYAPTADVVEVKHGRYIADTNYRTLGTCSECGGDLTCLNNYCPNCGAKMDGERRENESN